jgi:hypothetical protein
MIEPADPSIEFLLKEHERLSDLFLYTRESAERRATLYLSLTTAVLGAFVAFTQLAMPFETTLETGILVLLGLVILGVITFHRLIERALQGVEYLRAINRLHHYFTARDADIEPYLFWPPYDDQPHYGRARFSSVEAREVIALLNSIFAGACVGAGVLFWARELALAIGMGLVLAVLAWFGQQWYESRRFRLEEIRRADQVKYPSPPGVER